MACRRRQSRNQQSQTTAMRFVTVLAAVAILPIAPTNGFAPKPSRFATGQHGVRYRRIEISPSRQLSPSLSFVVSQSSATIATPSLSMGRTLMDRPRASGFEERMRNLVRRQKRKEKVRKGEHLPSNVKVVQNLDDYKRIVVDEKERIVVVRFFATWCKACQAITPLFYQVARKCEDVLFVEVPVTEKTLSLHKGLGVRKLPFAHIYTPDAGLVEEIRIIRPVFPDFAKKLRSYMVGSCDLKDGNPHSPYSSDFEANQNDNDDENGDGQIDMSRQRLKEP